MKRALLLPGYMGGGFGHVNRCMVLADALASEGWQVAFVLAGQHVATVQKTGHPIHQPRFPARPRPERHNSPAYTYLTDASIQVLRDGFGRPWRLRAAVAELMWIIRRFRPDVLIGDLSLLTWIVGQRTGLPVVQIVRSIMHPDAPEIMWWQSPPDGLVAPDIHPIFDSALRGWKLDPIHRTEDLLRGDLFLVPSIPQIEPLPDTVKATEYIGPLVRSSAGADQLPPPLDGPSDQPVVYVTLGGGAGPVGNRHFFEVVNEAFSQSPWPVIVSVGRKFQLSDVPAAPPNLHYYQWVPGPQVIQRSAVVVFHGGYGTTMEVVQHGVPSVVLPFHTEQESNGRRLEQQSAARVLSPSSDPSTMQLVPRGWPYGQFTMGIHPTSTLQPDDLYQAVSTIIADPTYTEAARRLKAAASQYDGAAAAVQHINQLV
ncbi:MAG: hypothetical protein CL610_12935 [Anaerolineaceae bacterium]|nr:hypothetical protein [Anaerolineaceae bacterium]